MSVDFTPNRNNYKDIGSFRFWCQKVLPIVYDDSLSYYELLNKVVQYLNDTIENVDLVGEDMAKLYTTYITLQEWVNNYFDNLDVQNEINDKLNNMATNGSLSALIKPLFDNYKETIDGYINTHSADIVVLKERVNTFTKLADGSTTGDAELVDGRIDFLGKSWGNIGEHIRGAYSTLSNVIGTKLDVAYLNDSTYLLQNNGYIRNDGKFVETENARCSDMVCVKGAKRITTSPLYLSSEGYMVAFYDFNKELLPNISMNGVGRWESADIDLSDSIYKDVVYVVVSNFDEADCFLNVYGTYDISVLDDIEKYISKTPLNGANLLIFGDSITDCCKISIENDCTTSYSFRSPSNSYIKDGNTISFDMWVKILKDIRDCGEIRNYALSGAMYQTRVRTEGNERQNVHYQIDVAFNDLNNPNGVFEVDDFIPNIVIFALGVNDSNPTDTFESAISTPYDELDTTNFNASVRKAFMRIKSQFPMAQIFVSMPIQSANSVLYDTQKYVDLKRMSERYGCIVIDGAREFGIVTDFEVNGSTGVYLKDGLHPNELGQNLMARGIIKALEQHYMPFDNMN